MARAVTEKVTVPSPVTLPPPLTASCLLSTPVAVTLIDTGAPEVCLTGILTVPLAPANSVMLAPPMVNSGCDWMVTETVALCVMPARLPTTSKLAEPAAALAGAVTLKVTDPVPVTEPPPLTAIGPVIVPTETEIGSGMPTVWLTCTLTGTGGPPAITETLPPEIVKSAMEVMDTPTVAVCVTVPEEAITVNDALVSGSPGAAVTRNVTLPDPLTVPPPLTEILDESKLPTETLMAAVGPEVCETLTDTVPLAPAARVMLPPLRLKATGGWAVMLTATVTVRVMVPPVTCTVKLAVPAVVPWGTLTVNVTVPPPITLPPPETEILPLTPDTLAENWTGVPWVWAMFTETEPL